MPRGANLHTPEQRAADDAKIRSRRHRYAIDPEPQQPAPEETFEEAPSEAEGRRASTAMRAVRASMWARPVISPDGDLVARELGAEYFLPFEDREDVIAAEAPTFKSWRIVGTSLGPAFAEPGKIPSLISEDELPESWFYPNGKGGNEAILVIDTSAD